MKFVKKAKVSNEVNSSSMSDIVFILLLFFMVTTVFRQFSVIEVRAVANVMGEKVSENPNITTSLKIDRGTNMGLVTDIQQGLRKAGALRVNYCAVSGQ